MDCDRRAGADGDVGDLLVLVNMADEEVTYTVPPDDAGHPWRLIVDTSEAHEAHFNHWAGRTGPLVEDGTYEFQVSLTVVKPDR